jgi:RHS repeat-associated protein
VRRRQTWTYGTTTPPAYAIGRLISVANGNSTTNIDAYDALGRVVTSRQTTGTAPPYVFGYSYNTGGLLVQETYPSLRSVKYSYDNGGHVRSVQGNAPGSSTVIPYAGSTTTPITYAPHGALLRMARGDGLVEAWTYNSRLQPGSISVGSAGSPTSVLGLSLYYCASKVQFCNANNGNLQTETLGLLGVDQGFTYDPANRLLTANEASGSTWSQTYGYDVFGNRWVVTPGSYLPNSSFTPTGTATSSGNFTSPTNQLALNGSTYDFAGNQTAIGGYAFQYDAENRQIEANLSNGANPVSSNGYSYDGEGRRVQKITCPAGTSLCTPAVTGATVTNYVYDAFGNLAAEYALSGTPPTALCSTCYLSVDHLGSTRALTDGATGAVVERHDYLPFGEEIYAGTGGRTTALKYISIPDPINVRQRFTGKERDSETGLDYFGTRYFSGAQGRFTSADEPLADQFEQNPQSWNLYSYGRNNPLRFVDPTGGRCVQTSNGWGDDGSGGGCDKAGVDANGNIQAQQVNVTAQGGNAVVAFATNLAFAASNIANDYFAWMFQQRPDLLQNTPPNGQFIGQAATAVAVIGTAMIGPGGEAAQVPREIKVTWKGLLHVLGRHSGGAAGKSFFADSSAITGLVKAAESATANPSVGGKFVRTVDAGRMIGTDITTGQPTSIYTVVTDAKGELVTAFPGNPRR